MAAVIISQVAYRRRLMNFFFLLTRLGSNRQPLLWHHSSDFTTLTQDEQFLFGSHLLVAPVLDFGARSVSFNLPEVVDGEKERAWWCEWDSGRWEMPSAQDSGSDITLGMSAFMVRSPRASPIADGLELVVSHRCTTRTLSCPRA